MYDCIDVNRRMLFRISVENTREVVAIEDVTKTSLTNTLGYQRLKIIQVIQLFI